MANIDIQAELKAVTEQIAKMVEELNKISTTRDQMIQQLQNINGVAMYLRGKLPEGIQEQAVDDSVERQDEYPSDE